MVRRGIAAALCAVALAAGVALTGCSAGEEYVPASKDPVITAPTIGEEGVLRVGVNSGNAPLAGVQESTGSIVGLDVDIAAAIADELGLKLEIVDVGTSAASALDRDAVDIVMGIDSADTDADIWKSDPYLTTATALFSATATEPPTRDANTHIAATISSESSWAVTNVYGADALEPTTSLREAFDQLDAGEVSYTAADAINGTYAVHTSDGSEAKIVALLEEPGGYSVGVLSSNSALRQAVTEALDSLMSGGFVNVVQSKWLGDPVDLASYDVVKVQVVAQSQDETEGEEGDDAQAGDSEEESTTTTNANQSGTNQTNTNQTNTNQTNQAA